MPEYVWESAPVSRVLRLMRGVVHRYADDLRSWRALTPEEAFSRVAMIPYVMDVAAFAGADGHDEVLGRPARLLELPALDCKKKAILLASWAEVTGRRWRYVAVDYDGGGFSHVYASVMLGGEWREMDATIRGLAGIGMSDGAKKRMVVYG